MGWKLLLGALFGSVILVACAGSATTSPASNNLPPSSTTAPTTALSTKGASTTPESSSVQTPSDSVLSEGGTTGGTLVQLFRDPPTLDPHITTDNISGAIVNEIFGGLVTLDPDLNIVQDLASWEVSSDGTVYTFHLNPEAKFHDGKKVTAKDVRWSLERATDPLTQSPVAEQYLGDIVGVSAKINGEADTLAGVRVIDDQTIELTIDAAKSYFLAKLTYPTGFILDRKNVENEAGDWLRNPNGTGPFKLEQYDIGETLRLARNEDYHLGAAFLDEVEFILSGGTGMLMYENDEIHITGVGLADLERVQDPSDRLYSDLHKAPPAFNTSYVGMNVNEPPLDDPKVRQALNYAANKEAINMAELNDLMVPAMGIIPPGFPSYNPDIRGYEYNPEKAKQLLSASTYGDNLDDMPLIILSISGSFGATVPLDLEVILQAWADLGIRVEIQQTEWATFLQDLHGRRFQLFSIGWGADYPDPENFLDVLFHSQSDNIHTNYNNPTVDALLERARVEPDQTTRFELYNQAEQTILDDAPWLPLWHSGERNVLVKPEVKNYLLTPMTIPKYRYVYFQN